MKIVRVKNIASLRFEETNNTNAMMLFVFVLVEKIQIIKKRYMIYFRVDEHSPAGDYDEERSMGRKHRYFT